MEKKTIPNKWLHYVPISKRIDGTRFVAFKVPIKENLCRHLAPTQKFFPATVIERKPKIALVIDLTNTNKYYNKQDFLSRGVDYAKVACPAKHIPGDNIVQTFFDVIDTFFSLPKSEYALIGIHCAHGVNRTGYMICKYMIMKMGIGPREAIETFNQARGHPIERQNYIEELLQTKPLNAEKFTFIRVPIETIYQQAKNFCENKQSKETQSRHKKVNIKRKSTDVKCQIQLKL